MTKKLIIFFIFSFICIGQSFVSAYSINIKNQEIINSLNQKSHSHFFSGEPNKNNSIQWQALNGPQMGKQIQIVQLKNHSNILFAFRPYSKGKIYQSNDTGKTWQALLSPLDVNLNDLQVMDEAHLLLGTDAGLYLSDNMGKHWRLVKNMPLPVNNIYIANPNLILVLTNRYMTDANIYRSIDGGHSWTPAHLGLNTNQSIWTLSGKNEIVFASATGLNISMNGGQFWTQPKKWKNHPVLSIAMTNQYRIFAATGELYQTDLTGQFWKKSGHGIKGEIETIKIDQHDRLYAIGREIETEQTGLYRSSDQGKTWQVLHIFKRIDHFTLLDNDKILITTQKGLMLSDQSQLNYTFLPNTFSTSEITDVLAMDENHLLAIDNNTLYRSEDGGKTWTRAYFGDAAAIVKYNNQIVLAADHHLILISNDMGKTWKTIYQFNDEHMHIGLSIQNKKCLLLRTDGQTISDNDHLSKWKKISNNPYSYQNDIMYIDDLNRIYVNADNAIQYSTDSGKTWISLLNNINAHGIISGFRSNLLIAAFYNAGVIKSLDNGKTWELINNGLTNFHFRKLKIIDENNYYLATEQGIFVTHDGGKNWAAENKGLENNDILSLSINNRLFLAGTKGSGVYKGENSQT